MSLIEMALTYVYYVCQTLRENRLRPKIKYSLELIPTSRKRVSQTRQLVSRNIPFVVFVLYKHRHILLLHNGAYWCTLPVRRGLDEII